MVRETPDYKFGEIDAKLEAIKTGVEKTNDKLEAFDTRLRNVEQKSAVFGSVAGGITAVVVSLISAKLKSLGF